MAENDNSSPKGNLVFEGMGMAQASVRTPWSTGALAAFLQLCSCTCVLAAWTFCAAHRCGCITRASISGRGTLVLFSGTTGPMFESGRPVVTPGQLEHPVHVAVNCFPSVMGTLAAELLLTSPMAS